MFELMKNKKGLIMGVINSHSIAWGIAQALKKQGAEIALSYPNERIGKKVKPLATELGSDLLLECDVTNSETITSTFNKIKEVWGELDFIVHAIAFSDKDQLRGRYLDTTLDNFLNTMHISCYSFTEVLQHASPLMKSGGSAVTLTYGGSERVVPNYNVMGVAKAALESSVKYLANDLGKDKIRINAISAGPIRTLASSGVSSFASLLNWNEKITPLRKNVSTADVGNSALYLLSNLSAGVTGEIHYVDSGYNIMGTISPEFLN